MGKSKKTMVAHAVILRNKQVENWIQFNAAAHLSAALGAREGRKLIHLENATTKDGECIPMNIQHAIVMKQATTQAELLALKQKADAAGMLVTCFTQDMVTSSDDLVVKKAQEAKYASDVKFLGVLVYGPKKHVEAHTASFQLIS